MGKRVDFKEYLPDDLQDKRLYWVVNLIYQGKWREELFLKWFSFEDVKRIMVIYIFKEFCKDRIIWTGNVSENITTKFAYGLLCRGRVGIKDNERILLRKFWKVLWVLSIM